MSKSTYTDLIYRLGDLAREHLAEARRPPRAMQEVFEREDELVAEREELARTEGKLNEEDADYNAFLAQSEADLAAQRAIVAKWRTAVVGVDARSRDLTKKLNSQKAAHRYLRISYEKALKAHEELELRESHDVRKLSISQENIKKSRLHLMRDRRHLEELEHELKTVLTPRPGQPGAAGILAHRRILATEAECEERAAEHADTMKALDAATAEAEERVKEAEARLDAALFALGEEVYAERVPHPSLTPLYAKVDKAR